MLVTFCEFFRGDISTRKTCNEIEWINCAIVRIETLPLSAR
ncbi:hypothetical protein QUF74_08615 [Candidatus Halobeggiatoa sp. HSG11]|nr:hypothetical protein [Candidatus Halobeggiatoa sp. HSG11]